MGVVSNLEEFKWEGNNIRLGYKFTVFRIVNGKNRGKWGPFPWF
jgi:hypothetical protein